MGPPLWGKYSLKYIAKIHPFFGAKHIQIIAKTITNIHRQDIFRDNPNGQHVSSTVRKSDLISRQKPRNFRNQFHRQFPEPYSFPHYTNYHDKNARKHARPDKYRPGILQSRRYIGNFTGSIRTSSPRRAPKHTLAPPQQ